MFQASQKLPNYLRAYRKRSGYSQEDLAYLLHLSNKSECSKLERFHCQPSDRTAAACETVFGVSISKIFPSIHASGQQETVRRMRNMRSRLAAKAAVAVWFHPRIAHAIKSLDQRLRELIPNFSVP